MQVPGPQDEQPIAQRGGHRQWAIHYIYRSSKVCPFWRKGKCLLILMWIDNTVAPLGTWYGVIPSVFLLTLDSKANLTGAVAQPAHSIVQWSHCHCRTLRIKGSAPCSHWGHCSAGTSWRVTSLPQLPSLVVLGSDLACCSMCFFFQIKDVFLHATWETIVWLGSWDALGWDSACLWLGGFSEARQSVFPPHPSACRGEKVTLDDPSALLCSSPLWLHSLWAEDVEPNSS